MTQNIGMLFRVLIPFCAAAYLSVALALPALATAYVCTDAKEEARLGASGNVSSNHGSGKCRWSVNGVSYSGAASEASARQKTIMALNAIFQGRISGVSPELSTADVFRYAMIGPFRGGEMSSAARLAFTNTVDQEINSIQQCIGSRGESSFEKPRLFCRLVGERFTQWGLEILPTEPLVILGLDLAGDRFVLAIPRRLMGGSFRLLP